MEILEDTADDPNAFPSPIETICTIWIRRDEEGQEKGLYLLIADQTNISFIELTKHLSAIAFGHQTIASIESEQTEREQEKKRKKISIKRSKMITTKMQEGWKLHQIQEIDAHGKMALVCEDLSRSSLVFFEINDLSDQGAIF